MGKTLILWVAILTLGYGGLTIYANTPGDTGASRATWPQESRIPKKPGEATLVLFVHPQCSCSRATVSELARLIPETQNKLKIFVLFYAPQSKPVGWVHGNLWHTTEQLGSVHLLNDVEGEEAKRFGALTSGQVFLYNASDSLVFRGGITPERGHVGESAGRDAILNWLRQKKPSLASTSVFGCALHKRSKL